MAPQIHSAPSPPPPAQPLWAFGVRLYWTMIGPGLLVLLLLLIAMHKKDWIAGIDATFVAVLFLLIVTRWIDFRYADPTLMTGEIAKVSQIRNYSMIAVILGSAAWLTATVLGIYFLE